ncbi:MAG: hypothetical protein HZA37_00110 [Parcubacteria group bacterium]|nr:hypothetical protein [Parcubacteria group bacterium]
MDERLVKEIDELFRKMAIEALGISDMGAFREISRPHLLHLNEILERLSAEEMADVLGYAHQKFIEATPEALTHIPVIVFYRDGGHGWGYYPKPPDGSRPRIIAQLLNVSQDKAEYGTILRTSRISLN